MEVNKMTEEKKEEVKGSKVVLGQVPTEYGLVFQTPDGVLEEKEYLVWLGNLVLDIKQSLVG